MIPRIPLSQFPINTVKDIDIENAYNWFKSFISDKDWLKRKDEIENYLSTIVKSSTPFSEPISEGTLLVIQKDQIGWYLYLVHAYLFEPHKYEYYQGARIIPIFKRVGMDINLITKITGINKKMRDLFKKRRSEADAILFEILTALLWVRNGWEVAIVEEGKGAKTPDFEVLKGSERWQVECKRQMKTADYTYRETKKRQIMISQISKLLLQFNILLDITFHVELVSLPDTYLFDILNEIIPKTKTPCKIISNEFIDIDLSFVDIDFIQNHLKQYLVKNNSPQLLELIANKEVDHSAFTSGFLGNFYYVGDGEANNLYINEIVKAFGVHCYCNSKKALNAKARDVRSQINSAISQFNPDTNSIVHIGMETFDGPEVEMVRTEKIMNTMSNIDPESNKLCWIFYHYFQSYTRSYMDWYFDETVSTATSFLNPVLPIKNTFLIIPEDDVLIENNSHWNKDLP
ncbi:hypothetical protein [Pedobacter sp. UBA4863]|uniref:hypothetical protein n=1 Tax=Pedobacter sp. UBA4863 TaxID=1947060 RepID=UPI0025E4193D|nr:hypothetical protein [Pedobacter sp. UBA4863]